MVNEVVRNVLTHNSLFKFFSGSFESFFPENMSDQEVANPVQMDPEVNVVPMEDDDDIMFKETQKSGPPKGQVKKSLARRSSILNVIRRQSKSMAGIPFEDQVSAIDVELSIEERLSKLLQISLSASVRSVQALSANEDSNTKVNDMVEDICTEIRRGGQDIARSESLLKPVAEKITELSDAADVSVIPPEQFLPARVKEIRDYRDKLNQEMDAWKSLQTARKEEYVKARADHIQVAKGNVKVTHSERKNVREDELQSLDGLSDGIQKWNRLLQMEKELELKKLSLCQSIHGRKRSLDEKSSQISGFAKLLKTKCDSLHKDENALMELGKETKLSAEVNMFRKQLLK